MTLHMNRWSIAGGWALASCIVIGTLVALGVTFSLPEIALVMVCALAPPCVLLMVWPEGLPPTVTDLLAAQPRRP